MFFARPPIGDPISTSDSESLCSHASSTMSQVDREFTEVVKQMRAWLAAQKECAGKSEAVVDQKMVNSLEGRSKESISNMAKGASPTSPRVIPKGHQYDELIYMFRQTFNDDPGSAITLRAYHSPLTGALFPFCQKSLEAITAFHEFIKRSNTYP